MNSPHPIKSISQISSELLASKRRLQSVLHNLKLSPPSRDMYSGYRTMDDILESIPNDRVLESKLTDPQGSTRQKRLKAMKQYNGDYQLLHEAKSNYSNLKPQARDIYYMALRCDLAKVFPRDSKVSLFHKKKRIRRKPLLASQHIFLQASKTRRFERNMLSPKYLQTIFDPKVEIHTQGKQQEIEQSLLTIMLLDSKNQEKTHQYLCNANHTLADVVKEFYCLISDLSESTGGGCFTLIEDTFYYIGQHSVLESVVVSTAQYQKVEMKAVRLRELRVVFGRVYFFRHLGGCDHYIVFRQLRVHCGRSIVKATSPPIVVYESKLKKKKCEWCKTTFSQLAVLGDQFKLGLALYLCLQCSQQLYRGKDMAAEGMVIVPYKHD